MRLAGVDGTVEDFNLRRTTVRDLDGVVHTVPNGEIKVASNLTRVWARINQDVTVAYGTDIDKVIEVVDEVGREFASDPVWKRRILETPRVERIEALGEYGVTLKILGSVRAPEQWAAGGEFRKRLLAALEANGIEIPRPQRVVLSRDPSALAAAGLSASELERGPGDDDLARRLRPIDRRPGAEARGRAAGRGTMARPADRSERVPPVSIDSSPTPTPEIENLLAEDRKFPPDPAFTAQANATADLYAEAEADPEAFWARLARERIDWIEDFHTTLEWDLPFAKWFVGGKLNLAYNCIDRHVERGLGHKVAYHWIGEPGDTRTITFADLQREVSKAANALLELGVQTGDRVAIYMPMIPELPIAMLACARIGAPHTVVFGGFSAEALSGRINDSQAKLVITADGGWRRGKPAPLKPAVDEALESSPTIEHALVVRRLGDAVEGGTAMQDGRDVWWHDIVERQSADCTSRSRSTASTCCTCSTPRARPRSRRASSTRPRATCWARASPTRWSSTSSPTTSTGAPLTSAGSPATATSSTGRSPTRRPASCTRAPRTRRTGAAGGRSSRTTRSTSCTAPRPRSAPT